MTDLDRRTTGESAVWLELVGSRQGWLRRCRSAAAGDPAAIAELKDDDGAAARALRTAGTRTAPTDGDPLATAATSYDWYVARTLRSFALALVEPGPHDAATAVAALDIHLSRAHLVAASTFDPPHPPSEGPTDGQDAVAVVAREVDRLPVGTRAVGHLLLADLTGRFPASTDSITVPVLFAGDTTSIAENEVGGVGATGKLTIERLASGPPGLHPDPRTMCFLRADDAFADGVQNAWDSAPAGLADSCFVWNVRLGTDAAQPVTDVEGGSLGGAFAVALESLSRGGRRWRSVLPRSVDPRCVVSAAVAGPDGALAGVTGLDQKTTAARNAGLRLIVATDDLIGAQQTAHGKDVHLLGAADVVAAARGARGHVNRRFRALVAVAVAVVLILAGFGVVGLDRRHDTAVAQQAAAERQVREDQEREAEKIITSGRLADRSNDLLATDPGLAGLTALAAYQHSPTPQSIRAMGAAAADDPLLAAKFRVPAGASDVVFSRTAAWLAYGNRITAHSLETGDQLGDPIVVAQAAGENAIMHLTLDQRADTLAAVGEKNVVTYAIDEDQRLTLIASHPIARPSRSYQNFLSFSSDGRRALVLDSQGRGEVWAVRDATTAPVAVRVPSDLGWESISGLTTSTSTDSWSVVLTVITEDVGGGLIHWSPDGTRAPSRTVGSDAYLFSTTTGGGSTTLTTTDAGDLLIEGSGGFEVLTRGVSSVSLPLTGSTDQVVVASDGGLALFDRVRETTYPLFKGVDLGFVQYVDRQRVAAVGRNGDLIVIDPTSMGGEHLDAAAVAVTPGGGTVSGNPGPAVKLTERAPRTSTGTGGDVVATYERSRTTCASGGEAAFVPYDIEATEDYVAVVGGGTAPEIADPLSAEVTVWRRGTSTPVVQDRCRTVDGLHVSTLIMDDEDEILVGSGTRIDRWQLSTGRILDPIDLEHADPTSSAEESVEELFQIDGAPAAIVVSDAGPRQLRLLDRGGGKELGVIPRPPIEVQAVAVASDGRTLAYQSASDAVTVMELPSMKIIATLSALGELTQIALSPNGTTLLVSDDDSLRFLDVGSGRQIRPARTVLDGRHDPSAYAASASWVSDDTVALRFDGDESAFELFQVSTGPSWKQQLCSTTSRLTEDVWRDEVSATIPYTDPCA